MLTNNQELILNFQKASSEFRLGKEVEGSHLLKLGLDYLIPIIEKHENKQSILALVPQMLDAQQRHDWLSLADILEYELTSFL